MEEAMSAIQRGDREAIRTRLRDIGLLMLDDVQFLAGQRGAQDELLTRTRSHCPRGVANWSSRAIGRRLKSTTWMTVCFRALRVA